MTNKKHPNFQDLYSIEDIKKAKQCSKETGYYPISLIPGNQYEVLGNTGHLGKYHLDETSQRIYTLKYWYAIQVWNTVIATSCNSLAGNDFLSILPHWENRDDSFRKLVNNERFNPEIVAKLWRLLENIANSGNIKVHEGFFIEIATKGYWGAPAKCHIETKCKFKIHIILDVENARNTKFPVEDIWEYSFCKDDKTYKWDEIKHLFCEVSLPVRELINHEWMRRENKYYAELFRACGELDFDGIKLALVKGANINAFDDFDDTPLTSAIRHYNLVGMFEDKEYSKEECEDFEKSNYNKLLPIIDYLIDNGADIDLFGYDGLCPLLAAYYVHSAPLVEYLLKKGANANVNCYLTDCFDEAIYRSTILSCIKDDCDGDDVDYEIECWSSSMVVDCIIGATIPLNANILTELF